MYRYICRQAGRSEKDVKEFDKRVHEALQADVTMSYFSQMQPYRIEACIRYAFREGHRTSEILSCNPKRRAAQMKTELNWDEQQIDYDRPSSYFVGASERSANAQRRLEDDRKRSAQRRRIMDDVERRRAADEQRRLQEEVRRANLPVSGTHVERFLTEPDSNPFEHQSPLKVFSEGTEKTSTRKTNSYQLSTQKKELIMQEKRKDLRIIQLRYSLAQANSSLKSIKKQKAHNTTLKEKVKEVSEIADSLVMVPADRRRVFIEVVDKAEASPLLTFEEQVEELERQKE